ncbi:hypothetical protein SBRCBS47491_002345 [Sporothrix bragantina]|uniref:Uncharacterized protein n=1 Tax=Sporothrix bragantina TaxID=671064 RepID=A0ABP0B619_9PEZI
MATEPSSPVKTYIKVEQGDDGKSLCFEDLEATKPPPARQETGAMPDKRVANLATLRDQAHSPSVQYEYVAVDCEGREDDDNVYINKTGITHIGLAYMPSSIPPPLTVKDRDEQGKLMGLYQISSHDCRRLQSLDLDDIVATYGVQASSTRLTDRESQVVREQFRYGREVREVATKDLPEHLDLEVERLVSAGQAWTKQVNEPQTELPMKAPPEPSDNQCIDSVLGPHRFVGKWSPSIPSYKQLTQRGAPTMRPYLASMQRNIEQRMIQQHRIQATFFNKNWAGSEGEIELKRLEEKHRPTPNVPPSISPRPNRILRLPALKPVPNPPLDRKTPSRHRAPVPGKITRRILVVWDVAGERRALDKLAPGFLKHFHGWVDLQQVATPVLRAASGQMLGHNDVRMSMRNAMLAVGFKPGFSLQAGPHQKFKPHDPGMDAVRTLGMLARLVAYPTPDMSRMLQEVHVAQYSNFHADMPALRLQRSLYPCLMAIYVTTMEEEAQPFPESLQTNNALSQLLRQRGVGEPQLLTMGYVNKFAEFSSPEVCVYYDTLEKLNAAVNALNGATVNGCVLKAELFWNPNKAWHCAYSQVPADMYKEEEEDGEEDMVDGGDRLGSFCKNK